MSYQSILYAVDNGVATVTLNRPDKLNAITPQLFDEMRAALYAADADDAVRVIVITGAGKGFCAGGDVRDGRRARGDDTPEPTPEESGQALANSARMVRMLHESPKVTIAALPGPAVGAGIGIALSTDLRIAAHSARIVPGWSALAFSGDFGGTWFLTRFLGASKALEVLLDNTSLDAETCLQLGLFNKVVADEELPGAALDWARRIAAGPRTMQRYVKANVSNALRLTLAEALPLESERMARCSRTDEHRQAVKAWLARAAEKRSGG